MKRVFLLFALAALTGEATRAAERPLRIDAARSGVEIDVKATVDSFTGKLDAYEADIAVDTVAERVTRAKFSFHFSSVKTGKADRDKEMHAWQDTPRHPDGGFTLASFDRGSDGRLMARGTLSLHGMAREIVFPVSVTHEGDRYAIDGDAALDTRDFGLSVIRKLLVLKVDPVVHVRFHLQGAPAEEPITTSAAPAVPSHH